MIFKIHYGLWFGALVGIIPFMFNYASEYASATGFHQGILYTILPFVALVAKPFICSVADKYACHHKCLLFFIFTTILGYGSLAVYPFFPTLVNEHKDVLWALYCLAALVGNTSMTVVNSIGDSLAVNSSQRKGTSYGEYRLWGPLGFGIFGAIWGVTNEIPHLPKYTPGILTMVVLLIINSILIAFWHDKEEFYISHNKQNSRRQSNNTELSEPEASERHSGQSDDRQQPSQISLLYKLVRHDSSILGYIFIFTFCGILTGLQWQFFFKYLEEMAKKRSQNFSLVATFALPVQAIGGELVFFMVSGAIIKRIGVGFTLVTCLFSFALRYLSYAYLISGLNVYWILVVELLQGPAFGLMYSALTHQANYYSERIDSIVSLNSLSGDKKHLEKSLHATLQGILGASFEGLGLGLGAIVGGRLYDVSAILMWEMAGFSALTVASLCLTVLLITKFICTSQ